MVDERANEINPKINQKPGVDEGVSPGFFVVRIAAAEGIPSAFCFW